MPRRYATQVHISVSRLLKSGFMERPPAWFDAVLQYPPIPLPPRATPRRTLFDALSEKSPVKIAQSKSMAKHDKWRRPEAEKIIYVEDRIRRQFFRDHPFEAFRSRNLLETDARIAKTHPVQGSGWKRLSQHGRNPTPEDAVQFAVNLHNHHELPLAEAYKSAIMQFRALRSEHQIATAFAVQEAEAYGSVFGSREIDRGFERERKSIASFLPTVQAAAQHRNKLPWTPVWSMPGIPPPAEEWTHGRDYADRVKEGKRPIYTPEYVAVADESLEDAEEEVEVTLEAPVAAPVVRERASPMPKLRTPLKGAARTRADVLNLDGKGYMF